MNEIPSDPIHALDPARAIVPTTPPPPSHSPHEPLALVWLKRDLRTRGHLPFDLAERGGLPYRAIVILEPSVWSAPDLDMRHLRFVWESLRDMERRLAPFGRRVEVMFGEAETVFDWWCRSARLQAVYSMQESGTLLTYDRDRRVGRLLRSRGVEWTECEMDAVRRGIRDREGWDAHWKRVMDGSVPENHFSTAGPGAEGLLDHPFRVPGGCGDSWPSAWPEAWRGRAGSMRDGRGDLVEFPVPRPEGMTAGGETVGWERLERFLGERAAGYRAHLSKPAESRERCSRLSTHLAWGNLSTHQVIARLRGERVGTDLRAFRTRLKWRSHFIQKFEMEGRYETECINRGYESLRFDDNPGRVAAWAEGRTGYPLVDACMRCVRQTGWINFRMRAMLVSFLVHHLFEDWRRGVHVLSRAFLDYEPGIHYPQFQMQAGTTGVHTLRIYNPVKQSKEHDPMGRFIKAWVPELASLGPADLHEPWNMPPIDRMLLGFEPGREYPLPIVPPGEAAARARDLIWRHRDDPLVRQESRRILRTHTRRSR